MEVKRETLVSKFLVPFLLILAIVSIYFLFKKNPFVEESVALEIFAPSSVSAGDEIEYQVVYRNRSKTLLRGVELVFSFPQGAARIAANEEGGVSRLISETVTIDDLAPGAEGRYSFKALLFGGEGEKQKAEARLTFKPEKINAVFDSKTEHELTVEYVPIAIKFNFPSKIHIGEDIEFSLDYLLTSRTTFSDLRLILTVPKELEILGVSRETQDQREGSYTWDIGELTRDSSGTIYVRGRFGGDPAAKKLVKAQIGSYDPSSGEFRIYQIKEEEVLVGVPEFLLTQEVGGVNRGAIDPGSLLAWKISYKNLSTEVLENLSITMFLEGTAFDYSSVNASGGTTNASNHSITWSPDENEDLAFLDPEEGGEFTFSVRVREDIPQKTFDDKNLTASSRLTAYVSGVTLQEVRNEFKLNSLLTFLQEGQYADSPIPNAGPIPPRVGVPTSYTVSWQLLNTTNDLSNVKVRAALPSYVAWGGKVSPSDAPLTFDATTGEVVWDVGKLSRGTGILMQVKRVVFQIVLIPTSSEAGASPELMSDARAMGEDTFTQMILEATSPSFDTTLPHDPTISSEEGVVQP